MGSKLPQSQMWQGGITRDTDGREDTASNLKLHPPHGPASPEPTLEAPRPQSPCELTHPTHPTGYRSGWWCPGRERGGGVRITCPPYRPAQGSLREATRRRARWAFWLCCHPQRWSLMRRKLARSGEGTGPALKPLSSLPTWGWATMAEAHLGCPGSQSGVIQTGIPGRPPAGPCR